MKKTLTPDEIYEEGLAALRRRLGKAGMIRFLQQFEKGSGDYTEERKQWVGGMSVDEIFDRAKRLRIRRKGSRR